MFVDVHSHVVPSGDDGVSSIDEGLMLCREAAGRGTSVLYATPHVWPFDGLSRARERSARGAFAEMMPVARALGLELRLGFELTPSRALLAEDPERYRLGELPAVLMELPFTGRLDLSLELAEHIDTAGLTPIVAHPERAEAILCRPEGIDVFRNRGWLLQANATSLLGYHGRICEDACWRLVESGAIDLVASDGHRAARPPFLDNAYDAVCARLGEAAARPLFDGSPLAALVARDGVDLPQRC